MSIAIRFENVSKRFALHQQRSRSLQETLIRLAPWRRGHHPSAEDFWALRDVSFEVAQGETIGLIGPNGVGKSTVLKLISRILEPTSGHIAVNGRVGALLELGAGFHPDLTGRENVYLNASMMGLSRQEVDRRFEEIVAFSELEPFIDVPVKHYSSGMYVRLGFAVAVHTDPEILLVDEVLAVGDAAFQRKCLEKVGALRQQGATLLLVSHTTDQLVEVCQRAIWMEEGRILAEGQAEQIIHQYQWSSYRDNVDAHASNQRWGTGRVAITKVELLNNTGEATEEFVTNESFEVAVHYSAREAIASPTFGLAIHHENGVHVTGPNTRVGGYMLPDLQPGAQGVVHFKVPHLPLLAGRYRLSLSAHDWMETEMFDYHDRLYAFFVRPGGIREHHGVITLSGVWSAESLS